MADLILVVDAAVEVPVNLMPLLDDTDFKTRETAIAYNAAGMDLVWNFVTTAGAITQTAVTPTTGGTYDWTHVGDGIYKIEIPASGGASINNDTEGFGWFSGVVTGVLPWRGPTIQFSPANVVNSLVNGSDLLQVDLTQIGGDAQSATDLKDFADAGYDPATNKVQGVVLVDTLTTYTGNTPQTGDSFARLGAPVGASTSADIAAVKTVADAVEVDTQDIQSRIPAALVSGRMDASVGAMAANTLTASSLASDAVTEIQNGLATATALQTVDDEIATLQTSVNDVPTVSEFEARTIAAADYATATNLAAVPTANENADALLDRSAGVETGRTMRQALRLMLASMAGKLSGAATTTVVIRDTNDSKDRITATVDADGNRTAITYDVT